MSDHQAHYFVLIPAAGLGLRMGANVPKQYLKIQEKTLLEHTLSIFTRHPKISKIVVVLNADDFYWQNLKFDNPDKIITTLGGEERVHSVMQGLTSLQTLAAPNDWVLVHDAVRPCLSHEELDRLIEQLRDHSVGGLLGVPVADTLKKVDEERQVMGTLPRKQVWCAQTPQMFRFSILYQAIEQALKAQHPITDDASAVEYLGEKPQIIIGHSCNIKVTWPEDLKIVELFMKGLN